MTVRAHFSTFRRKTDIFDEKSKTGLGFEFGKPQQKCQRRPTLQSMANPAVLTFGTGLPLVFHFEK